MTIATDVNYATLTGTVKSAYAPPLLHTDAVVKALQAEIKALKADAERYRWLAARHDPTGCVVINAQDGGGLPMPLGDVIDAAIAQQQKETT